MFLDSMSKFHLNREQCATLKAVVADSVRVWTVWELTLTYWHKQNCNVHAKYIVMLNVTPQQKQEQLPTTKARIYDIIGWDITANG